jgi:hypothetical protein
MAKIQRHKPAKPAHKTHTHKLYKVRRPKRRRVQYTTTRGQVMNMKNPYVLTLGAFLSAWAASNFAADYRSILWALLAGVFGYATPKK